MSKSDSTDPTKYVMRAEHRLGKGKDGFVDIKGWTREVKISAARFFGKMADPIELGYYPSWAQKGENVRFKWTVNEPVMDSSGKLVDNFVEKPYPKPDDPEYDEFVEQRDIWRDLRKRWINTCPMIIGFLMDGTMDAWTRDRLIRVIDSQETGSILQQVKRGNDPLRLMGEQSKVHYYAGNQVDKNDKLLAEKTFRTFRETPIGHGVNVTEHKNRFEEHIRKLTSLGSLGNPDPRDDKFSQEDLFDTFTEPLKSHYHYLVRARLAAYDIRTIIPNKKDPKEIDVEYGHFESMEKEPNRGTDGKEIKKSNDHGGSSVLVTDGKSQGKDKKSKGKVNSAEAKVRSSVNKKIEKEKSKEKKGPFIDEANFPISYAKIKEIQEKKKCSFIEALRELECFHCHKFGHVKSECPTAGNLKIDGRSDKKKFKGKKKGVNSTVGELIGSGSEDDSCFHFVARGYQSEDSSSEDGFHFSFNTRGCLMSNSNGHTPSPRPAPTPRYELWGFPSAWFIESIECFPSGRPAHERREVGGRRQGSRGRRKSPSPTKRS